MRAEFNGKYAALVALVVLGCGPERTEPVATVSSPSHFGTLADMLAAGPLPQPVQNYIVEAMLLGRFVHGAYGSFREFRPADGLTTRSTSHFAVDPSDPFVDFCLVGTDPAFRAVAEAEIAASVPVLTDGLEGAPNGLNARFLPSGCLSAQDIADFGVCAWGRDFSDLHPDTIFVFLDEPTAFGGSCGSPAAYANYRDERGDVFGSEITGGSVRAVTPAFPAPLLNQRTLRHELTHVFGFNHTFGRADTMSYRLRSAEYAEHEKQAFSVLNQLPVGLGLRDLIELGVIEDSAAVLAEPLGVEHTEVHQSIIPGRVFSDEGLRIVNSAFAREGIIVLGQRLTVPLSSECCGNDLGGFPVDPFDFTPPIVRFGSVEVVSNLDRAFQMENANDAGVNVTPFGDLNRIAHARLRVVVPAGPGSGPYPAGPLSVERYDGTSAVVPNFAVDTAIVPPANSTPLPPTLSCTRQAGGSVDLAWTLPATHLDGATAFVPANATAKVFHNGQPLLLSGTPVELPATVTQVIDTTLRHPRFGSLYQVYLVDNATGEVGVPSNVCKVEPRQSGVEVTLLLLDATGSMAALRADGMTRFQAMVGPLPAGSPGVPRAFAALDEVFASARPPRVAVWSFDSERGLIDHVQALSGDTFTSDRTVAENALLAVRALGVGGATPLVDNTCISGSFLLDEFANAADPATYATFRIFTDGEENFSVGVPECPASCAGTGTPGSVPWDPQCRPGQCPSVAGPRFVPPVDCTQCQVDLFDTYCPRAPDDATRLTFFTEYFGQGGPFSPLPPDSGYFLDLAAATSGRFTHNADDGTQSTGFLASDRPPVALAGETQILECTGPAGALARLQGDAYDEDPNSELRFEWTGPFGTLLGPAQSVTLPVGVHDLELFVSDEHQTSMPASVLVNVTDTTHPGLDLSVSPAFLWPPNHKFVEVTASIQSGDTCDGHAGVRLVSITSNEPAQHGAPFVRGADFGTDDRTFALLAERLGGGPGRVYTIRYEARDAAGNLSIAEATVRVPHDRR